MITSITRPIMLNLVFVRSAGACTHMGEVVVYHVANFAFCIAALEVTHAWTATTANYLSSRSCIWTCKVITPEHDSMNKEDLHNFLYKRTGQSPRFQWTLSWWRLCQQLWCPECPWWCTFRYTTTCKVVLLEAECTRLRLQRSVLHVVSGYISPNMNAPVLCTH